MAEKGGGDKPDYVEGIDGKWIKFTNPLTGRIQDKFELFPEEERKRRAQAWGNEKKGARGREKLAGWIKKRKREARLMGGAKDD